MNYRVGGTRMSAMATNWRYKLLPGCLAVRRLCGAHRVLGIAAVIQLIAPSYARATADAHKSVEIAPPNQEHSSGAMTVVELTPQLETYRDAVRKMPDDPSKWIRYADELRRTVQRMRLTKETNDQAKAVYQEAIHAYNKALALTPNNEKAHFGLYFCWDGLARLYEDDDTRWMAHMERSLSHAREAHRLAPQNSLYRVTVEGYEKLIAMRREAIEKREAEARQLEALNRPVADAEIEALFEKLTAISVKDRPPVSDILPVSNEVRYRHKRDSLVYDVVHARHRVLRSPGDVEACLEYVRALRPLVNLMKRDEYEGLSLSLVGMGVFDDDFTMYRCRRVVQEEISRQMERLLSVAPEDMRVLKLEIDMAWPDKYEKIVELWERALRANPERPDGYILSQMRNVEKWTDDFIETRGGPNKERQRRMRERARDLLSRYPDADKIIEEYLMQSDPPLRLTEEEALFLHERVRRRAEERDFKVDSRILKQLSDEERVKLFHVLHALDWARLRWRWEKKPDPAAPLGWEQMSPYMPRNMRSFEELFRPAGGEYDFGTVDAPIRYVP